jgi:hypothetical protein
MAEPPFVLLVSLHDHQLWIRLQGSFAEWVWDCDPLPCDVTAWLALLDEEDL